MMINEAFFLNTPAPETSFITHDQSGLRQIRCVLLQLTVDCTKLLHAANSRSLLGFYQAVSSELYCLQFTYASLIGLSGYYFLKKMLRAVLIECSL